MTAQTTESKPVHELQCMEIWGGVQAVDVGVAVTGIDAWVFSKPFKGGSGGGDVHYVTMCGHGLLSRYAVADVSGHGEAVADVAGRLRDLLKQNINTLDETRMVQALNRAFTAMAESGTFATALLATYFAPEDHLIVCNAGHPRPLWYRADEGRWQILQRECQGACPRLLNLPLGVIDETSYYQFAVPLAENDLVLVYTDALTEAADPSGAMLGEEGLLRLARTLDPVDHRAFGPRLIQAVTEYREEEPWQDDVTLLLLHHNAEDAPVDEPQD